MPTGKLSPCSTHAAVNGSTLRRSDRRALTETEWKRGFEVSSEKPHLRVEPETRRCSYGWEATRRLETHVGQAGSRQTTFATS